MTPQNQYNPVDKITTDVPLFIRILEYAKEDAQTDMDLHQVAENALELLHTGQVLTMRQYDQLVGNTELKENKNMKKELIAEAKRMQKLAGMLNEEQGYEDMDLGFDEDGAEAEPGMGNDLGLTKADLQKAIEYDIKFIKEDPNGEYDEQTKEAQLKIFQNALSNPSVDSYIKAVLQSIKNLGFEDYEIENETYEAINVTLMETLGQNRVDNVDSAGLEKRIKELNSGLNEMSRTAGTGGAYNITSEGEAVLKQVKATKEIPEGLRPNLVAILIFLYKAKKEGTRAQKKTFADSRGVPQPAVNSLFNMLEEKGLISKEGYVGAEKKDVQNPRPKADVSKDIEDLELDENNDVSKKNEGLAEFLTKHIDKVKQYLLQKFPEPNYEIKGITSFDQNFDDNVGPFSSTNDDYGIAFAWKEDIDQEFKSDATSPIYIMTIEGRKIAFMYYKGPY